MIYNLILFIISVLPIFLIGFYIYKIDKEKEPLKLLVKLFLGGIGSCFLVLIISALLKIFPIFYADPSNLNLIELFINIFIGVALVEEFSKWIIAYKISYNHEAFDYLYDAILYCIFVSIGFAFFENILYVYGNGIVTGIMRAVLAVPSHACNGMLMGYYLGLAKLNDLNNNKDLKKKYLILSILIPTITHGIYDYCIFSQRLIFIIIFFIFVIAMYAYVLKKIKNISSIDRKMKYKDNYCPNCGHKVESNFCPICGRKNE